MNTAKVDIKIDKEKLPKHIAIIPDGNQRWARSRGLPEFEGHRKGFDVGKKLVETARNIGIHTITLWGFSTENWNRSKSETDFLMRIFEDLVKDDLKRALEEGGRIYHLGRKDRIPNSLAQQLSEAEEKTKDNKKNVLNIAIDYGGHDEILRATQKIVNAINNKEISAEDLSKQVGFYNKKYPYYLYKNFLDTKDQPYPYPDLIIRTSGEQRLSGYLPWQAVYAELYFPKFHFPDFTEEEFVNAIKEFCERDRSFGGNKH